jgi:hypothetical protein
VSTRAGVIHEPGDPPRPDLEGLVHHLDVDAARSRRLIRQLIDDDAAAFLSSASRLFRTRPDLRESRQFVAILLESGLLLPALSDPALTRETAMALARTASRVEPKIDVPLARALADKVGESDAAGVEEHARLMEILAAISDGARIFPSLVRLLRHPDPHIRSKAVLMIGRGNRSAKWVQQRLADTDPRIRANAAEALWGIPTAEARELLQSLLRDPNNRVAGNAVLGLYRLGDCSTIPELIGMARHESTLFRATAAWVMGETGDPRFTEVLAALLREPNAVVRKRAFAALGNIRASLARAQETARSLVVARLLDTDPGKPRRLLLAAVDAQGPIFPAILPAQILLYEDGQPVVNYRVTERPLPDMLSVVFLFPRTGSQSALSCLRWKRPGDLWAAVYYTRETPAGALPPDCIPRFQCSPEAIAADWDCIPQAAGCAGLYRSIAGAVSMENGALVGKRRLIVFADPAPRVPPSEDLIAAVAAAQAFVQVISSGPDPVLEEFCRRVKGVFWSSPETSTIQAYLTLFSRYEVVYQPPAPQAQSLKVRLHGPALSAETLVALPPSALRRR